MGFALISLVGLLGLAAAETVLRMNPGLLPETAQLRLHWRALADAIPNIPGPSQNPQARP